MKSHEQVAMSMFMRHGYPSVTASGITGYKAFWQHLDLLLTNLRMSDEAL